MDLLPSINSELIFEFICDISIFNTAKLIINDKNILNRVMQNMENDSANEVNTLYPSVMSNAIHSQQNSTRATSRIFFYMNNA